MSADHREECLELARALWPDRTITIERVGNNKRFGREVRLVAVAPAGREVLAHHESWIKLVDVLRRAIRRNTSSRSNTAVHAAARPRLRKSA